MHRWTFIQFGIEGSDYQSDRNRWIRKKGRDIGSAHSTERTKFTFFVLVACEEFLSRQESKTARFNCSAGAESRTMSLPAI